jgi:hypothetical protein
LKCMGHGARMAYALRCGKDGVCIVMHALGRHALGRHALGRHALGRHALGRHALGSHEPIMPYPVTSHPNVPNALGFSI